MTIIDKAVTSDEVTGDLLKLLYVPLSVLANLDEVLAKGNPKKHEIDKLRRSIIQNGFIDPAKWDINLNGGRGGIIYGNGRTEALVAMLLDMKAGGQSPPRGIGVHSESGEWCIPVKFGVDAESEIAAKRFIVDHNLLTASGLSVVDASAMFETEAYLELLSELKEEDALPLSVGEQEYLELLGSSGEDSGESSGGDDEVDDPTELEIRDGLVQGSIWQLGRHRIMCGDSTDEGAIALLLEGKPIDLIFTDPPYSVSYADKNRSLNAVGRGNRIQTPIANDHLSVEETAQKVWLPAFSNAFRFAKAGCVYYLTAPQGGDQMMMMMMMKQAGWLVKHELIWVKNNHVLGRADYHYKHEPIIYGWKPGAEHYFIDSRSEFSVWFFDKPMKSDLHPTMKPPELIEYAITNSSRKGELVADFFLGSGSTLVAAEKCDRTVYGMELSEHYCEVIMRRWEKLTGEVAKLL